MRVCLISDLIQSLSGHSSTVTMIVLLSARFSYNKIKTYKQYCSQVCCNLFKSFDCFEFFIKMPRASILIIRALLKQHNYFSISFHSNKLFEWYMTDARIDRLVEQRLKGVFKSTETCLNKMRL